MNRLLAVVGLAALMACGGSSSGTTDTPAGPTSLQIEDVTIGTGATAVAGDTSASTTPGPFSTGACSTRARAGPSPLTFLGADAVIPGFDQGIVGMRVGGRRALTIPSSLAYGARRLGPRFPPNTPLQFDVTLVSIAGK